MRSSESIPTLAGSLAVLIWGLSLPLDRIMGAQIGIPAVVGLIFLGAGLFGLLDQRLRKQPWPEKAIFKNPYLYGRWIFFVMHELCVMSAVLIVQKPYVSFVILLNYLWPTAIILCSILFAGVKVTRYITFIAGTFIVLGALSIELLNNDMLTLHLFDLASDRFAYFVAFVGAVAWGMYSALARRAGTETGGGSVVPLFQLSIALVLPLSFIPGWGAWERLTPGVAGLISIWCLVSFFAYLVWDLGIRRGNIVILSLFADFIPWLSLLAAHLMLGVDIGRKTVLSAICLVAGAMTVRYGTREKKRNQKSWLKSLLSSRPPSD